MVNPARSRRGLVIALLVTVFGVGLAYAVEHIGAGWVERNRSTLIAAIWLYLPLPFILRSKKTTSEYGIGFGSGLRGLIETIGASIAVLIPFYAAYFYMYPIKWGADAFSMQLFSVALAQFLVIALPEEFFFRGYLQTELEAAGVKKWRILGADVGLGWLAASGIFALAHIATMPTPFRAAVLFPALMFGWVRARTKSVLYSALMHTIFNFTFIIAQRMAT